MTNKIIREALRSNRRFFVNIEITPLSKMPNKIRARAKVSDVNDNVIPEFGTFTSKPQLIKNQQLAVNEVIEKAEKRYQMIYGGTPATAEDLQNAFDAVVEAVESGALRIMPTWKQISTNKQELVHFSRHCLPILKEFINMNNDRFTDSDRRELYEHLVAEAEKNIRSKEAVKEKAKVLAEDRMEKYDAIYAHMRNQISKLPELSLKPGSHTKPTPAPEQVKSLPRRVLMRFYRRVKELVITDAKFAFFVILVIFGLRPGEAAARKPGDIKFYDKFCVVYVNSSVENGKIKKSLKNDFSRRLVVIAFWGMCKLKTCIDLIGDDYPKDDTPMNNANICASRVKELLLDCGAYEASLEEIASTLDADDLDKDDTPDISMISQLKIACYVLRRVFATICRSIMGLSSFETDRLLGHRPVGPNGRVEPNNLNKDMNNLDTLKDIAQRMERYVFDPECTLNPFFNPIEITDQDSVELIEFSGYQIVNQSGCDVTISFNIEAAEMGETIKIDIPSTANQDNLNADSRRKEWGAIDRLVIGDTTQPGKARSTNELKATQDQ